jgi:hypothetical protein
MSPRLLYLVNALRTGLPFQGERDRVDRPACRDSDADVRRSVGMSVSERPTVREMLAEIVPLIGVIPVAGPPLVLVAAPWLLFALMLAGPFALLVTIVIFLLAARLLIVALAAIAASPYLLVRHLRAARTRHSTSSAPVRPVPANRPAVADRDAARLPAAA